jgi:hypothetical protein
MNVPMMFCLMENTLKSVRAFAIFEASQGVDAVKMCQVMLPCFKVHPAATVALLVRVFHVNFTLLRAGEGFLRAEIARQNVLGNVLLVNHLHVQNFCAFLTENRAIYAT